MAKKIEAPKPSVKSAPTVNSVLHYLRRNPGHFVFPIKPGAKYPPVFKRNLEVASRDPAKIRLWAETWPGANWGLALAKSGLIVMDVDQREGKVGRETLAALEAKHGKLPRTRIVKSPSGGRHYYFTGKHVLALGVNGFGLDLDSPNYVLLVGSVVGGIAYEEVGDRPIVAAPDWFGEYLKKRERDEAAQAPVVDLDQAQNVEWARHYLTHDAPPAIEGSGGEFTTLKIAMTLRDHGISEPLALELMQELYNFDPMCVPEWDFDELKQKVHNAFVYAHVTPPGGATATADFEAEPVPEIPETPGVQRQVIARKILGLLNKTKKKGCTQEEAESATAKARELTTKYGITEEDLHSEKAKEFAWMSEFAIIIQPPMFVLLANKALLSDKSFDKMYGAKIPMGQAHAIVNRSKRVLRYNRLVYRPGALDDIFEDNEKLFNIFRPSAVTPLDGEPELFLAHMNYLIPDARERGFVLDWLAWCVQHPERKMMFALLLVGPEGTGKSWVADLMTIILGPHNVSTPRKKSITRDFNGWIARRLMVVIHELHGKAELAEELKDHITQKTVEVNIKNVEAFEIENYANFFTISNSLFALPLSDTDRRYLAAHCAEMPKDSKPIPSADKPYTPTPAMREHYRKLFGCLGTYQKPGDEVRRVMGWLQRRQIVLDCETIAPETEARSDVIAAGRTSLEKIVRDLYRDKSYPFGRVYSINRIFDAIDIRQVDPADRNINAVEAAVRKFGGRPIKAVGSARAVRIRNKDGSQTGLWAMTAAEAGKLAKESTIKLTRMYENDRKQVRTTPEPEETAKERAAGLAEAIAEFSEDDTAPGRLH